MREFWRTSLGRLRVLGFLEGISFLVLLGIAMPLKYFADQPAAVQTIGMAHGVLFILYVLAAIHVMVDYSWPWHRLGLLVFAAVLPFGPFVADAKLLRSSNENQIGSSGPAIRDQRDQAPAVDTPVEEISGS